MPDLETAISIAIHSHSGQKDKANKPYILHPLRLMLHCDRSEEMIVAILHDVIEDSDVSISSLREVGFSSTVLDAIECLTKKEGETYQNFINRLSVNELARKVKILDIKDNLDVSRLEKLDDIDLERVRKYHKSLHYLLSIRN